MAEKKSKSGAASALLNNPGENQRQQAEKKLVAEQLQTLEQKEYDPDEFVTFLRLNWGDPALPSDKVDYIDEFTGVGGVFRNIPYQRVQKWLKLRTVRGFVLDNEAGIEDFIKVTGRDPRVMETLNAAIQSLEPDKIFAFAGVEKAEELGRALLSQARLLRTQKEQTEAEDKEAREKAARGQ